MLSLLVREDHDRRYARCACCGQFGEVRREVSEVDGIHLHRTCWASWFTNGGLDYGFGLSATDTADHRRASRAGATAQDEE